VIAGGSVPSGRRDGSRQEFLAPRQLPSIVIDNFRVLDAIRVFDVQLSRGE
jgi:hypothetical protein